MRIQIKDFAVSMELGNNGVTMDVYKPDGTHLGDIRFGRGTIEWCKGRTRPGNGSSKTWTQLIDFFEEDA